MRISRKRECEEFEELFFYFGLKSMELTKKKSELQFTRDKFYEAFTLK